MDTYSYDDIERHYIDIVRFQALQTAVDGSWPCAGGTDADGLSHLDSYTRSYKDRLLRARMEDALSDFNIYRLAKADSQKQDIYETTVLTVRRINHFAELRFGIHFKDTNEFGLYGVFYGDRDEPYRSFYRSDSEFTKEISLRD